MNDIPILIICFNRYDSFKKLFSVIREHKPKVLYISIDGPRNNNSNDLEMVNKIKEKIKIIEWNCDIKKKYNLKNLGCKVAVTSAIDWFFKKNEMGIILEDDCLPNLDFFDFCYHALNKYKDVNNIMQISGNNFLFDNNLCKESYYVSAINDIWGWATWKRAWSNFDIEMKEYNYKKDYKKFINYYKNKKVVRWMKIYFDNVKHVHHNIWSTQWTYTMIKNNGFTIVPKVNLVKNIGFNKFGSTSDFESFTLYDQVNNDSLTVTNSPNQPEPNYDLDKIRFKYIKKTDPNLFFYYRIKKLIPRFLINFLKFLLKRNK